MTVRFTPRNALVAALIAMLFLLQRHQLQLITVILLLPLLIMVRPIL